MLWLSIPFTWDFSMHHVVVVSGARGVVREKGDVFLKLTLALTRLVFATRVLLGFLFVVCCGL